MKKVESPTIEEKAMMIIESICLQVSDRNSETLGLIYRISHTANTPDCRRNHPDWTREIERMFDEIIKGGL